MIESAPSLKQRSPCFPSPLFSVVGGKGRKKNSRKYVSVWTLKSKSFEGMLNFYPIYWLSIIRYSQKINNVLNRCFSIRHGAWVFIGCIWFSIWGSKTKQFHTWQCYELNLVIWYTEMSRSIIRKCDIINVLSHRKKEKKLRKGERKNIQSATGEEWKW